MVPYLKVVVLKNCDPMKLGMRKKEHVAFVYVYFLFSEWQSGRTDNESTRDRCQKIFCTCHHSPPFAFCMHDSSSSSIYIFLLLTTQFITAPQVKYSFFYNFLILLNIEINYELSFETDTITVQFFINKSK